MTSELSVRYFVEIHIEGVKAQTITAPALRQTARKFRDCFEMNDLGVSSMVGDCGKLYRTVGRMQEHIGRISYNGRLWALFGDEMLLPSTGEQRATSEANS